MYHLVLTFNKMKKIKFKRSFKLFGSYRTMTVGKYMIVFDHAVYNNKIVCNHEAIHYAQINDVGFVRFYLMYVFYFIKSFLKYQNWDKAYRNIPFEREAYKNQPNLKYLNNRAKHEWQNYIY